jgi:2,4-dienoyl-CoA reductase (NADPH2)
VAIIGGAIQGCELAEFLTKRGRKVTLVEKAEVMGEGMVDAFLGHLLTWFKKKGVTMISGVKEFVEVTDKGLTLINKEGERQIVEADTVIPTLPLAPNMRLVETLKGKVPEIYAIGDCKEPRLITDAIAAGTRTARAI